MKLRLHAVLLAALLTACGPKQVSFNASSCYRNPTEETRERRIQTNCMLRGGSMNPHNPAKPCLMWNHRDIVERKFVLECRKDVWSEI